MAKIKDPTKTNSSAKFITGIIALIAVIGIAVAIIVTRSPSKIDQALDAYNIEENVNFNVEYDNGVVTLAANNTDDNTPHADLFEDYSCQYCKQLNEETGDDLLNALNNGDITVSIYDLTFLDDQGATHSTQSFAGAIAAAETGDATDYWNYRKFMYTNMDTVYGQWNGDLPEALTNAGFDPTIGEAGNDDAMLERADKESEENRKVLEDVDQVSTPAVIYNGERLDQNYQPDWVNNIVDNKIPTAQDEE